LFGNETFNLDKEIFMVLSRGTLARMIDHTILCPEATEKDVRKVVGEAIKYHFVSVCVNGRWVSFVRGLLQQRNVIDVARPVLICAVVGFPLGASTTESKVCEARQCVAMGAQEIDVVISLGDLLDDNFPYVVQDIRKVVMSVKDIKSSTVVKVILETAVLTEDQVKFGCEAAHAANADFVKTSTGFHPKGGATEQAVRWLEKYGGELGLKVKASGGIRDLATAEKMIAAGADRLGCSRSVEIISELPE
jgi:deoxyribose-phosphate aldolase